MAVCGRCSARLSAAALACVLLSALPAEADPHPPDSTPKPVATPKAPIRNAARPSHPTDHGSPGRRDRMQAGASHEDAGIGSADLRALRRAEAELFPPSQRSAEATPDLPLLPLEPGAPEVIASGLPPSQPLEPPQPPPADQPWLGPLDLPDLPVRWDERVVRYLAFFRDDPVGHTTFANLYRHSGRWRDMMRQALRSRSLPEDLVWVSMIESGFDPVARSSAGAAGLWQFMPETAKLYGLTVDRWLDQRLNATASTAAAAAFLDDLHRKFGSWDLALAGYSMGTGGLAAIVRRYNTNDFWSLARTEGTLPWETTLYVPKVLATAIVAHNLAAFGFDELTADPPVDADAVDVPSGTPLSLVAQAAGCASKDLEALNPELRASRTPPALAGVALYAVRVPQGKGAATAQALSRLRKDLPPLEQVVVRFGETLEQIASTHHTTAQRLVELNAIAPGETLRGGTTILVPKGRAEAADPEPATPATAPGDGSKPLVIVPSDTFVYPDRERIFYRVVAGDTLAKIASALGAAQDDLRRWNDLDPGARLQEGMTLQVFVQPDADLAGVVVTHEREVRVVPVGSDEFFAALEKEGGFTRTTVSAKSGETVEAIGKRFGVAPRTMERVNRRPRSDVLGDGETVVVYVPRPTAKHASPASGEASR